MSGERLPLLKKQFSSLDFKTSQYNVQRSWPGFGDAEGVIFSEGQTHRVVYPRFYNLVMRILLFAHFVTGMVYCWWLLTELDTDFGYGFGNLFCVAEILSFVARCVCFTQFTTKSRKAICPLHRLTPAFSEAQWPVVQFCVTHYKEPVAETYQTVKNLLDMDYPVNRLEINVLDDGFFTCKAGVYTPSEIGLEMTSMLRALVSRVARGVGSPHAEFSYEVASSNRPEAAPQGSLVIEFKHSALPTVRHINRKRGAESHFKGGNLNNAVFNVLSSDTNQFFAFLDCDMAPTPDFLQLSMPLFFEYRNGRWQPNWEVAMTQAPQSFHNLTETNGDDDPLFQTTDVYWRRTMLHLDHWGLVHYYGTNVVMFKPALEDSVGWQYGVLSEDTPTGANLTSLGWKALYVDQDIATGLVKDTVVDTLAQRKRWAVGNVLWGLLKDRTWLRCLLTGSFSNPPFYDAFLAREAAARAGAPMPITDTSIRVGVAGSPPVAPELAVDDPEMAHPEAEEALLATTLAVSREDSGVDKRARRAASWWHRLRWELTYWHVTWSNPINALWFVAYLGTACFMLIANMISGQSNEITINVLYPALHFVTTTTVLFVIGPQSTLWRGCQDRFAFAWVRFISIFDAFEKAMRPPKAAAAWNSSAAVELMVPPLLIFVGVAAMWGVSATDCLLHFEECAGSMQSFSLVSASMPVQIVGLFLGCVILISMFPMFRCSLSNLLGYPMYKFRVLPGGAIAPYFLAMAPVVIFTLLFFGLNNSVTETETASVTQSSLQVCVRTANGHKVAPSVFLLGGTRCATTSMYEDVQKHLPLADWGEARANEDASISKDKHFFDDEETYNKGWSWYLDHYANCSAVTNSGLVGFDFTETYLESDASVARTIYEDYSKLPLSGDTTLPVDKVRFIVLLRDPIDRLHSYYSASKADGTLDVDGIDGLSTACTDDLANCDELDFDTWARDMVERASDCDTNHPDEDLWPKCGSTGLFGGLYADQLLNYLDYFNATQISLVPMDTYVEDAPHILRNLADWLDMDIDTTDFTEAAISAQSVYENIAIAEATRDMLTSFYEPHVDGLLDIAKNTDVHFVDVVQADNLFRRRYKRS